MLRKLYWALMFSALLIAFADTTRSQIMASPSDVSRAADGPTATEHLSGIVLNSVTGQPVPGVLVTSPGSALAVLTDYQGRFPFDLTRRTQPTGGVSSQQRLPLAFQLRKPGYLTRPCLASVPFYASSQASSAVELRIVPAGVISGRIDSESGALPAATVVTLFRRQVDQGRPSWIQGQATQTNSHGEYRFADLPSGDYKVASFGSNPGEHAGTGAPSLEGLVPAFYPNADNLETAAPVHLSAGESKSINLTLRSAVLYRAEVPVVVPAQEGTLGPSNGIQAAILPQRLGADLAYDRASHAVAGYLPSGSYDVRLSTSGPQRSSASVRLNVSGSPVRTAPVTLHPAVEVPIYIRWDSISSSGGSSRQNYRVNLPSLEPGGSVMVDPPGALQRFAGAAHVVALSEGLYQLQVLLERGYMASAISGTTDLLREPLHVGPGESPQPIQITLADDGASLHVTVANRSPGAASSGADLHPEQVGMVVCIPLDQPARQPIVQFAVLSTAAEAGSNFANMAPGRYLVVASLQDEMSSFTPEYRNPDALTQLMSKGVVVTLSPKENAAIQVPLFTGEAE